MKFIKLTDINDEPFFLNQEDWRPISFTKKEDYTLINYKRLIDAIGFLSVCKETPEEIMELLK